MRNQSLRALLMGDRFFVYKFILLIVFALFLMAVPESASAEKDGLAGDNTDTVLSANDENMPLQYTLTVSYVKEDEDAPFQVSTHLHEPGFSYNIASPVVEGYRPASLRLFGTIDEDSEITVKYFAESYNLTIHYRFLSGEAAAPDHRSEELYGTEYSITSPQVPGNVAVTPDVRDTMPGRDVEWTVFYVDKSALINY